MEEFEEVKKFWDERASLGHTSGSNDFVLKDLETKEIMKLILKNSKVLEIGCGNGKTLINLAKEKNCSGIGIDYSEKMIELANKNLSNEKDLNILFKTGNAVDFKENEKFDYVLTQRCLINIKDKEEQFNAFQNIFSHLKNEGKFIMIEDTIQGLEELNKLRKMLDLYELNPPFHNLFLDEEEVKNWEFKLMLNGYSCFCEKKTVAFASTYYFLSRVVYAKLSANKGIKPEELKYDSEINVLSYNLPSIGNIGAPKLWIWRKK